MLLKQDFKTIIELTPLVSIDFLIKNKENKYLLGYRKNAPAKGFYFVPGGRIFKDEQIQQAKERIMLSEIGNIINTEFFGYFEHHYKNDSFFDNNINTHYIVLAFEGSLENIDIFDNLLQHDHFIWLNKDEILENPEVHQYTKNYFI